MLTRLRLILNELERIASHLIWLGTHALDIGAMTVFFYTWRERDQVLDLKEMLSGVRMMTSWICPGGLRGDTPLGWIDGLRGSWMRSRSRSTSTTTY